MGWWASDTAHLRFDGCRVPVANLIGPRAPGLQDLHEQLQQRAAVHVGPGLCAAQVCFDEALDWARQRHTFGAPLSERQVIRHKLMDMALKIDAARCLVYELAYRIQHGLADPRSSWRASPWPRCCPRRRMQFCADAAVQILGGMGFMRGTKSERIYREVKVMMIGPGRAADLGTPWPTIMNWPTWPRTCCTSTRRRWCR
jgi:acyl-CoA dehydrogenase